MKCGTGIFDQIIRRGMKSSSQIKLYNYETKIIIGYIHFYIPGDSIILPPDHL